MTIDVIERLLDGRPESFPSSPSPRTTRLQRIVVVLDRRRITEL